jgi:hypothetical protein
MVLDSEALAAIASGNDSSLWAFRASKPFKSHLVWDFHKFFTLILYSLNISLWTLKPSRFDGNERAFFLVIDI